MPCENDIRNLLGIKDKNITFPNEQSTFYKKIGKINYLIVDAVLKNRPKQCPHCGSMHINVKDYYNTCIEHLASAGQPTKIHLKRCRYECQLCTKTFTSKTHFVMPNCSISRDLYLSICIELRNNISHTDIAKRLNISVSTVQRTLKAHAVLLANRKPTLPKVLCVDEFKGPKGQMCFIACDGETSEIVAILPYRDYRRLYKYFSSYSRSKRKGVKYLVMDMNASYNKLIKAVFPCAQLVTDRFHIVQHINRNFNMLRVQLMKQFSTDSKEYKLLKKHWKLLLMDPSKLSTKRFKSRDHDWRYVSPEMIVTEMLGFSPLLNEAYKFIIELKLAIHIRKGKYFFEILDNVPDIELSNFKNKFKVFNTFKSGVLNAMSVSYSNGRIEGLNNRVKATIRTAYGYRNFTNLKARIFMQRKMFNVEVITIQKLKSVDVSTNLSSAA
jgi:transposase